MKRWTEEEIKILKNQYRNISKHDLLILLNDRTWRAIKLKAFKLKLTIPKSIGTPEERFWRRVDKGLNSECWNWTGNCDTGGYGKIKINGKMISTHRFSYEIHKGKIPDDKPFVLHHCDNPKCVNPSHLRPGTYKDNSDDMILKERQIHPRGENHGRAKLTWDQVKEIRRLCHKRKLMRKEIAKMFNVDYTIISKIHRNKIWKHKN